MTEYAGRDTLQSVFPLIKGDIAKKQDKLTGAAGQVVGFNAAGQVQGMTLQAGENVSITQKGGVVTISAAGGGGSSPVLQSIYIQTPPTKTFYHPGEEFDPGGMVVMGKYDYGSDDIRDVEITDYTYPTEPLVEGTTTVTISYSYGGVTCTADVEAKVIGSLNSTTWADISAVADAGLASDYWAVGDTKTIVLNGQVGNCTFSNLSIDAFILGFDHNSDKEGTNRIDFQIGKIGGKDVALCDSVHGSE